MDQEEQEDKDLIVFHLLQLLQAVLLQVELLTEAEAVVEQPEQDLEHNQEQQADLVLLKLHSMLLVLFNVLLQAELGHAALELPVLKWLLSEQVEQVETVEIPQQQPVIPLEAEAEEAEEFLSAHLLLDLVLPNL